MVAVPELINANTRRQVIVTRFASGVALSVNPTLQEVASYLRLRLARTSDTPTQRQLERLIEDVEQQLNGIYGAWTTELRGQLRELAGNEIDFQDASISALVDIETSKPNVTQVIAAARENPLQIGPNSGFVDYSRFINGFRPQEVRRITSAINGGFAQGQTTSQIVRNIVGTRSAGFNDGILNTTRREAQLLARTAVNHISTQAKDEFNRQNDIIIGYRIVATLDSRTSNICKGFDGEVILKSAQLQPMPPFHPNCRTTTAPELDGRFDFLNEGGQRAARGDQGGGQAPAEQTYYSWLRQQDAAFQDEALGRERGLIFRNAGLTPEEFRTATRDQFGRPLTLEQMSAQNEQIMSYLLRSSQTSARSN